VLVANRGIRGTAAHREVIAAHRDPSAVNAAATTHEVRGPELDQLVTVVFRHSGNRAVFVERTFVEQPINTLADGQLAAIVLALDILGAAQLLGQLLAAANFIELRLPGHIRLPPQFSDPSAFALSLSGRGPNETPVAGAPGWPAIQQATLRSR